MATYIDLRRMHTNDKRLTSVFLTFTSRLDTDEFREAIKSNTVIEEVVISADESFFYDCSELQLQDVFEAIGRLPRLRKLSVNSYPNCRGIVSMKAINPMLQEATNLQSLTISDVHVTGSANDFNILAERVQRMFFLHTFSFAGCNIILEANSMPTSSRQRVALILSSLKTQSPPPPVTEALLDSLLMSLSILPSLTVVYLEAKNKGGLGNLSVPAATALCLSASIRMLKLRNLGLSSAHATSMAMLLERNPCIQSLDLGSVTSFETSTATAVGNMLRRNASLLEFELCLDKMIPDASAEELSTALRRNNTLRSFALKSSATPKTLGRVTTKCRKAFLQMLQYNYQLEKFFLFRKYPLSREFKLYSSLNKMGRGDLLQKQDNAHCPDEWVNKLAQVKDDLNAIYYFVSCNPTLCMNNAAGPTKRKNYQQSSQDKKVDDSCVQPKHKKRRTNS